MRGGPATDSDSVSTRQDLEDLIAEWARQDPAFRRDLLADPKAALNRAFGVELPPEIEIRVLEETPSRRYLVIPFNPDLPMSGELTDAELESVGGGIGLAGGTGWVCLTVGYTIGPPCLPLR